MKKVAIILAPGFEEIEAVAPIDILRRAGVEVIIAGLTGEPVPSARNVKIVPDVTVDSLDPAELDLVILPGGAGGVENLKKDERVKRLINSMMERNKKVAAICAAPTALVAYGVLGDRKATVYPSLKNNLGTATYVDERVVVDEGVITSQGPGTAIDFGLKLVEILLGYEKAKEVAERLLVEY